MSMVPERRLYNFQDNLTSEDRQYYEWVNWDLVEKLPATGRHAAITEFLNDEFRSEIERLGLAWVCKQAAIGVQVPQAGSRVTTRIPDVTVVTTEQWQEILDHTAVLVDSSPLLIVEVVSEDTKLLDHRHKRAEYNVLEVPEYWVVDFLENDPNYPPGVTVFSWVEGFYEEAIFRNNEQIISHVFPELVLTVDQVLTVDALVLSAEA